VALSSASLGQAINWGKVPGVGIILHLLFGGSVEGAAEEKRRLNIFFKKFKLRLENSFKKKKS
jgi:hypothetical protein